jgi:glycosyltransferase involved in cell wall biosynthesis
MDEFCGNDERGLMAKGTKQLASGASGELRFVVDTKDMAEKMNILYEDKKLREKMGQNAQEWVKEYTWEKIAVKFDKMFKGIKIK